MKGSIELMNGLVGLAVQRAERMAAGEDIGSNTATEIKKYAEDLQTLADAVAKLNELETKKFLLVLTSTFASTNPLLLVLGKKILEKSTALLVEVVSTAVGKSCDGDCEKCEVGQETLAETDCIGKA